MMPWPDARILDLLKIKHPLFQAPMAGADSPALAIGVSKAGGLGALGAALLSATQLREQFAKIRSETSQPINLNFFCHRMPAVDSTREKQWLEKLKPYYEELNIGPSTFPEGPQRQPFNEEFCSLVEELKPGVVSFHFGFPEVSLVSRLKKIGQVLMASASSAKEAQWLEQHGADVIIAQGLEAGGHQTLFLSDDLMTLKKTFPLIKEILKAVKVPVVAAGGIGDAKAIVEALSLGAAAVQLGTAYLFCPEATISQVHREALKHAKAEDTALTNVFSGRPARGILNRLMREIGPISPLAPKFPRASSAISPLRKKSEQLGRNDFAQMWAGQSVALGREMPAQKLTETLVNEAFALLQRRS